MNYIVGIHILIELCNIRKGIRIVCKINNHLKHLFFKTTGIIQYTQTALDLFVNESGCYK